MEENKEKEEKSLVHDIGYKLGEGLVILSAICVAIAMIGATIAFLRYVL